MTKNQKRPMTRILFGTLACLLAVSVTTPKESVYAIGASEKTAEVSVSARATVGAVSTEGGKISYTLPGLPNRNVRAHKRLTLKVNGKALSDAALVMNGATYLPLRSFLLAFGEASVSYDSASRTATAKMTGLSISVTDGGFVTYANDRPLFSFTPAVLMNDGNMYVPATALTKALGIAAGSVSGSTVSYFGTARPLVHASRYYREDEVLWLSRIISAEARGESLIGQIAVGNVIMNRVRSASFPNTIWGVIFDKRYGIQFSPVANGTVYNTPTYTATLAAKICLEGTSLSYDTLYFLNPRAAHSSWIANNRKYAYTILNHDFYY